MLNNFGVCARTVSYTHLDVYKRQALEYARNRLDEMEEEDYKVPVCMGGVLNQNTAEGTTPVDVSGELEGMGVTVVLCIAVF